MISSRFAVPWRAGCWLAACGGGGGGDIRTISPGTPSLQGSWQLTISFDGNPRPGAMDVAAGDVPAESEVTDFTTAVVAQLVAIIFPDKKVDPSGSTLTVTDPDTNYVLVVNSFSLNNDYDGCGTCAVGTDVSFSLKVNFSESGRFDGRTVPDRTFDAVVGFRYARTA